MADGLWQQHRDQIQGYVDGHKRNMLDYLAVSNIWPVAAHSDDRYDTITVRIVAACADYDVDDKNGRVVRGDHQVKQWEEDWTFQRSSKAETKDRGDHAWLQVPQLRRPPRRRPGRHVPLLQGSHHVRGLRLGAGEDFTGRLASRAAGPAVGAGGGCTRPVPASSLLQRPRSISW